MDFFFGWGGDGGALVSVSRSEICAERRSLLLPIQTNDIGLISAVVCVWRYCYDKQAGRHGSLDFRPRKRWIVRLLVLGKSNPFLP
jgi:hypothetical protein